MKLGRVLVGDMGAPEEGEGDCPGDPPVPDVGVTGSKGGETPPDG